MTNNFKVLKFLFISVSISLFSSFGSAEEHQENCSTLRASMELKELFFCGEYEQVIAETADLHKYSSENLYKAVELRAAALFNLRQLARAYLFLQQAIIHQEFNSLQVESLKLMSNKIFSELGNIQEDQEFVKTLKRPDSLEVNFRLAIAQQANENWKGLTATLRRILMMDKNNSLARTLLVRANIRVGNLAEAEKELSLIVADRHIKKTEREAAQKILDKIKSTRSPHKWNGVFSVGTGKTKNPLGVSETGKAVFTAFPGQLLDFGETITTESYEQGIVGLSYKYLMPYDEPEVVKIDSMLFERTYDSLDNIDLSVYSLSGAYQWENLGNEVKMTANHVYMQKKELMSSLKISGSYRYYNSDSTDLNVSASASRNYFWSRNDSINSQENTGYLYSIGTSGSFKPFNNSFLLKTGLKYDVNDLQTAALSKKAVGLDTGAIYIFNENLTGNVGFIVTRTEHEGPDSSVSTKIRKDNTFIANISLTAKFDGQSKSSNYLPATTFTYSKTNNDSNILNYDKTSSEWGFNLIWAF